jgi:hypothetical protein
MTSTAITVKQNIFMQGAQRWSPKGLCYQPQDGVDPLSDDNLATLTHLLDPATKYGLLNLGINCLRVYQVDPTKPHDKVMALLAQHGIYVLVGTVNGDTAIPRNATSVPAATIARVKQVADAFAGYDNVLGFSVANELLDAPDNGLVAIAKQVKQQMQAYMQAKNYRAIPIGICTRDDPAYTLAATLVYACGDADTRMDFIGYNCYRWVVPHGQQPTAGAINAYYELYDHFKSFPIPVMLTEIGAQCEGGRDWTQIPYIFGAKQVTSLTGKPAADMASAVSGCFVFRYYEKGANFGLVNAGNPDPTPVDGGNGGGGGGYDALSAAYKGITEFRGQAANPDPLPCAPTGGLQKAVTVTLTNNMDKGQELAFNYSTTANPGENDWSLAAKIAGGGAPVQFKFPAGTQAISMAYQQDGKWYGGCQLSGAAVTSLKDGQTITGSWAGPDGNGACPVS